MHSCTDKHTNTHTNTPCAVMFLSIQPPSGLVETKCTFTSNITRYH